MKRLFSLSSMMPCGSNIRLPIASFSAAGEVPNTPAAVEIMPDEVGSA